MKFRTILIDDEPLALSRLKRLLSKFEEVFDIIAEASNGEDGKELIEEHKPDLIFLDIEMPVMNGFEMLSALDYMPRVIFSTAYDQYAIKAFEENSVDYLLKPVEKERLEKTVAKLKSFQNESQKSISDQMLVTLLSQLNPKKEINSITVKTGDKIKFINLPEISHFHADGKYVFLNTADGKQYLTNQTLTVLEEKLPNEFVRISRSAIVQSRSIREMEKYFNGKYIIIMDDTKNTKLESGSTYSENLKNLIDF